MSKQEGTKTQIIVAPHDPRLHSGLAYVGIWAGDECAVTGGSRIHLSVRRSLPHRLSLGQSGQEDDDDEEVKENDIALVRMKKTETTYLRLDPPGRDIDTWWRGQSNGCVVKEGGPTAELFALSSPLPSQT